VASAGPISQTVDGIRRLEDAGAAAVVMSSLFEEQIKAETDAVEFLLDFGAESHGEALSYFPPIDEYDVGVDRYLEILRRASEDAAVPVIGSINGVTSDWWVEYARHMEEAGAAGIELNVFHVPTDPTVEGWAVERRYVDILAAVKGAVDIPVAIKLNPYFSAMGNMAGRLSDAGADALVLFNRFYQPDFDLERMVVEPSLVLSQPFEIRLPLLWIAVLYGQVGASLAATTGVRTGDDVVKYLLAGADVVMTTSALLENGAEHLGTLKRDLVAWMQGREYESVEQMRGSMSQRAVADPDRFVRANYIRVLEDWRKLGSIPEPPLPGSSE
jgi:dihydroorotate dehydrogenase (fumarate)